MRELTIDKKMANRDWTFLAAVITVVCAMVSMGTDNTSNGEFAIFSLGLSLIYVFIWIGLFCNLRNRPKDLLVFSVFWLILGGMLCYVAQQAAIGNPVGFEALMRLLNSQSNFTSPYKGYTIMVYLSIMAIFIVRYPLYGFRFLAPSMEAFYWVAAAFAFVLVLFLWVLIWLKWRRFKAMRKTWIPNGKGAPPRFFDQEN